MQNKQQYRISDIREKIISAVNKTADPIRQTLSPKGGNVIFQDGNGQIHVTNDGVTIIKNLQFSDPIENAILDIIKHASLQTNQEAGDATSTTVLLSSLLVKEGLKLIDNDWNCREVEQEFEKFGNTIVEKLKELAFPVKTDQDLHYIASVSSSGDEEVAKNVVKTIKTAGTDGMVFIEPANSQETEILEDTGFNISAGMFAPELRNNSRAFSASYLDVPVLITDKRLYYAQEAETILSVALRSGYKEVVIVAADFIGDAPNYFIANHTKGNIRVLLVKAPQGAHMGDKLEDLATYLGGQVVSDKKGSIVDNLKIEDFVIAKKAFSDGQKTIISRDKKEANKKLDERIEALRKELKKHGNKDSGNATELKSRLASMTNGIVTIRVGGSTPIAVNEKIYRYEDAVNATREAMKSGYLVGGGLGLLNAFKEAKFKGDTSKVFRRVCEAPTRQIAENCGLPGDIVMDTIAQMDNPQFGFNALTGQYGDLLEAGVVDPLRAVEMAIKNSVSVAGMIIGSGYLIVNEIEDNGNSKK